MKAPAVKKAVPRKPRAPRAPRAPVDRSVSAALERLLKSVELDEAGDAKAAIARALATKLDQSAGSDSGPVAMATAGIARELREVIDAILEANEDDEGFVPDLFSEVGNS